MCKTASHFGARPYIHARRVVYGRGLFNPNSKRITGSGIHASHREEPGIQRAYRPERRSTSGDIGAPSGAFNA